MRTDRFIPALFAMTLSLLVLATSCGSGDDADDTPGPAWRLTMSDEFDGDTGAFPNPATWTFDVGGGGWGNHQLEYDTNLASNVSLDGAGHLRIVARKEAYMGRDYTSGRIKTQGLFSQRYGRFEARIKLPSGQGIWPAFWMLGDDVESSGWPQSGEIDIMELRGQQPQLMYGTIHGPGYSGQDAIGSTYRLTDGTSFGDDFHIFAIEWDPGQIRFWVDSEMYQLIPTPEVTARGEWVFDQPFFLLLNVAVGGDFVGPVGSGTEFPAEMLVDYVRVYERAS